MSDYESIYQVITQSGVFEAVWGEEPLPVEYRGDATAILSFKSFLALNHVSGAHGILLNADTMQPDELYLFCQPDDSGIVVIPPLDDLIAYDHDKKLLNQEFPPALDSANTQESNNVATVSGIEKLKLVKELGGIHDSMTSAASGMEKLKMVKRMGEIRVIFGGTGSAEVDQQPAENTEIDNQKAKLLSLQQLQERMKAAMNEAVKKPRGDVIVPAAIELEQALDNPMKTAFEAELDALKAETDIDTLDTQLDDIMERIDAAGLSEALDAPLRDALARMTYLLAEAEKTA